MNWRWCAVETAVAGLPKVLDPKALDEQTARLGVADFDRFRTDFLAARPGGGRSFRDPSGDYLDLLRRLEMIDNGAPAHLLPGKPVEIGV